MEPIVLGYSALATHDGAMPADGGVRLPALSGALLAGASR